MLKKLLKHDLSALKRTLLTLMSVVLVSSVFSAVIMRLASFSAQTEGTAPAVPLASTAVFVFFNVILILVCPLISLILSAMYFYRSFYTDEGYLTFTLPVKRSALLASKYISAVIWLAISFAVSLLSVAVALIFGAATDKIADINVLSDVMKTVLMFTSGDSVAVFVRHAVGAVIYLLYFIAVIYLAVTVGSIVASKHRGVATVGFLYIITLATSLASDLVYFLISVTVSASANVMLPEAYGDIVSMILYAGFGVASYMLCLYFIKNDLNLQ